MARRTKRRRLDSKTRISIKRTDWILGIPYSAKTRRGLEAEQYIFQSLEYYRRKKTEFPGGRRMIEVTPTAHFSQDDREGKDIFAKFQVKFQPDSEVLPIQVQNWWTREVEEEYREKGICLIAIWLADQDGKPKTPDQIKKEAQERTFDAISKWFSRVEKEVRSIS